MLINRTFRYQRLKYYSFKITSSHRTIFENGIYGERSSLFHHFLLKFHATLENQYLPKKAKNETTNTEPLLLS